MSINACRTGNIQFPRDFNNQPVGVSPSIFQLTFSPTTGDKARGNFFRQMDFDDDWGFEKRQELKKE